MEAIMLEMVDAMGSSAGAAASAGEMVDAMGSSAGAAASAGEMVDAMGSSAGARCVGGGDFDFRLSMIGFTFTLYTA